MFWISFSSQYQQTYFPQCIQYFLLRQSWKGNKNEFDRIINKFSGSYLRLRLHNGAEQSVLFIDDEWKWMEVKKSELKNVEHESVYCSSIESTRSITLSNEKKTNYSLLGSLPGVSFLTLRPPFATLFVFPSCSLLSAQPTDHWLYLEARGLKWNHFDMFMTISFQSDIFINLLKRFRNEMNFLASYLRDVLESLNFIVFLSWNR